MKNTGLDGYAYDFRLNYDIIAVDDILDISKYLMRKIIWHKMIGFIKKIFFTTITFFSCNTLRFCFNK